MLIVNELIIEIMNKSQTITGALICSLIFVFSMTMQEAAGQQKGTSSPAIPDNVHKIFAGSCTPCHTNDGRKFSQFMLNFDKWINYSPAKQSRKGRKIVKMISKGKMPPRYVSKSNPDIIPSKVQVELIIKWADSLKPVKK